MLDDATTRFAVTAERAALGALGGGCQVPIGIFCERHTASRGEAGAGHWQITGSVFLPEGGASVRVGLEHRTEEEPRELGLRLAEELLRQGAGALLTR